ncbi:MAG TPA: hypothetical protein ENJ56_00330 [Anaerolineae bacterium]|nr:hypothetical protein [Anaerolineae bacterium]
MKQTQNTPPVPPFMILVLLALLAALWAGLLRIGWQWPTLTSSLIGLHGPLMVSGFLGTLIGIERAVALRQRWCFASPLLIGLGALLLIMGIQLKIGMLLLVLGSAVMVLIQAQILRIHYALHTVVIGAGALLLFGGNLLWLLGKPISQISYWWAGFLLLVIAGERLELSRVLRLSAGVKKLFGIAAAIFGLGLLVALFRYSLGVRIASAGVVALALWLWRYDLARRNIHKSDLVRYIAWNLLIGYAWLTVSGLLGMYFAGTQGGVYYDAWLHTLFLGFAMSMIFAHAPIILPAILGITVPYRRILYSAPVLLHFSLLLRIFGDLTVQQAIRKWGGLLNALAILAFFATVAFAVIQGRRKA